VIVADPHPVTGALGGQAFFAADDFAMPWVRNRAHPVSDYITSLLAAGFRISAMQELNFSDEALASNPISGLFPDVLTNALVGLPFILIIEASYS